MYIVYGLYKSYISTAYNFYKYKNVSTSYNQLCHEIEGFGKGSYSTTCCSAVALATVQ